MGTDPRPIHTLNARGHVMLEVMRDFFKLDADHMLAEIQGMRRMVVDALAAKLMLSFVAGGACATISVFGSEGVPPGTGVVTEIANDPAVAMSEAGIEAKS